MMLIPCIATVFFLLELSGRRGVNADTDNKDLQDKRRYMYDFGLGKRAAYSYVSEYKRLPVYNFGLGKRASNDKVYPFGLGNRDYELEAEYPDDTYPENEKRGKQYAFGLGKRLPSSKQFSFGLGKRPEGKMYSFGLGKRSPISEYELHNYEDYDSAEERKRAANNDRRFSFGIGKRQADPDISRQERSMHYNFGLGKRNHSEDEKETTHPDIVN